MFLVVRPRTQQRAVAQGFSVQVWGTWSRWFKSSLPEKTNGTVSAVPFCFFCGHAGFESERQAEAERAQGSAAEAA